MKTMTAISAMSRTQQLGAFLPAESGVCATSAPGIGSRWAAGPDVRVHVVPNPTKAAAGASGYALVTDPSGSVTGRPPG